MHSVMVITSGSHEELQSDPLKDPIHKILIVRATFRIGDSLLAIPAIWAFRERFPKAQIDFVGAPVASELFSNLPINNFFKITRRYPGSGLDYPLLLRRLRSIGYDLAVDVSCSQSAMGSFLVGFSGARSRVGVRGKWDRWLNVRLPKTRDINKYRTLPNLLNSLCIECKSNIHSIALTCDEKEKAKAKLCSFFPDSTQSIVGVFIGARKTWGKRWPVENFRELITALHCEGRNVVVFAGPEEKDRMPYFRAALEETIPLVLTPSLREFAGMLANCDLFVTCDSGPMHLAYALGVLTVAIFQYPNFDRWAPPTERLRIAYQPGGCSSDDVLRICRQELSSSGVFQRGRPHAMRMISLEQMDSPRHEDC